MTQNIIDRVRRLVNEGGMTRAGLARAAGLHANTLRDVNEPEWNPTAETLGKLERFLDESDETPVLVSIEEIIEEARNGRMYILVDDEDRENEGDLIIPAQMATPAAINFMATYGRGLVCLALSHERVDQLGLEPMSRRNGTPLGTAFTVSIEAKEGISTGISAADRARTVSVAIDGSKGPADIVSPGHVFPLRARPGGVLVRTGHTEAAVDISRLAGLNPSAVICEVMSDDGTMARLDDLLLFGRQHGIKIATIRDLIAYRRKHDRMVSLKSETSFKSRFGGDWQARAYANKATGEENLVLLKGRIDPSKPTLVRMHSTSMFSDLLGEDSPRANLLHRSMEIIGEEGAGVIVFVNRPHSEVSKSFEYRQLAIDGNTKPLEELRDYGVGAQVLAELGIHELVLLTNTHHTLVALEGYGLTITEERRID
ncbi:MULTISPECIES: 3,4-dihydroxy-2-butanone-4-phosphate synthase [unclassified Novosphingobium]|uniref:3,4-dihydroxy-2-butanone-4-phosphate synthase n=1 Tax=unclassified Novosphingobium TaxID=2644732 RepID=UPI00086D416F|nr:MULTISPECIES: 3,4-dihydroxy-2-butanone-4-phosphate synthase [unclassified Novosphingobium]MBN9143472.1 3,4-dihydroxy-2-butanone-4-phosphate synthase [Novosphingobium sp.]MDR6706721.1 3,4-dihydroxy 2-butanone 4-phosphate synthase/GTP cyclohydrolase II [Novosphingobium sp. 1748]NKI99395.1 3,4-dihydroxy 2-butanone 4-phosphate synthase/GTP cyclohydrolase II [Novosphingobium sp. SG707]ODU83754.1 MAG: 3,4-dihydroxy-2-butanone-4-phosphate synthase [Novosphingobium sp. SCN 63-17]OJX92665.1 MAG: 3,4